MRILLADDEIVTRKEIAGMLESFGYDVIEVEDGVELLKHLNGDDSEKPDLVVADIAMPKLNGYEAATIAKTRLKSETPIIGISENSSTDFGKIESPFVAVLDRPIRKRDILKLILTLTCRNCHCSILSVDHKNHFHFDCKRCGKRYILRVEDGELSIKERSQ